MEEERREAGPFQPQTLSGPNKSKGWEGRGMESKRNVSARGFRGALLTQNLSECLILRNSRGASENC